MRVSREYKVYSMSPDNKPAVHAKPGDIITIETMDCYDGMVGAGRDSGENIDRSRINPATGPIFVEGAAAGDTLVVEIKDINVADTGIMRISPHFGILREYVHKSIFKFINVYDGTIEFNPSIKLPVVPMVGVIGNAPRNEKVGNESPGDHGGNMDTREIKKGSRVYLPVKVDGGLLAMGDIHASMGDGESSGTGVEICGEITIKVDIVKGTNQARPFVETEYAYYMISSAAKLEDACKTAVYDSTRFIMNRLNIGFEEAYMLTSLVCNLIISQVVNPMATVRMEIPKSLISN